MLWSNMRFDADNHYFISNMTVYSSLHMKSIELKSKMFGSYSKMGSVTARILALPVAIAETGLSIAGKTACTFELLGKAVKNLAVCPFSENTYLKLSFVYLSTALESIFSAALSILFAPVTIPYQFVQFARNPKQTWAFEKVDLWLQDSHKTNLAEEKFLFGTPV
jgi:hypothetical protein